MDTGQWTLGSNAEKLGYFFGSFGHPPSYFGFEGFISMFYGHLI